MEAEVKETEKKPNKFVEFIKSPKFKKILIDFLPLIGIIFLIVLFEILSGGKLLTGKSIKSMYNQAYPIFICALAGVYVMSTGNLDFSVGANMAFSATMGCFIAYINTGLTFFACVLIGLAVGVLTASIHIFAKIPTFIAGLCMMFVLQAITQVVTNSSTKNVPSEMMSMDIEVFKVIFLIIYIIVMVVVFNYTKIGKSMKALGVSQEASKQSGIKYSKMLIIGYALTGLAAGLAGYFSLMRTYCASYRTGMTMTVDVIIAIVLGGMAVTGGSSSKISAALYGTIMTVVLTNGITLAGLGGAYGQLIKGLLFLVVVAITSRKQKNAIIQ